MGEEKETASNRSLMAVPVPAETILFSLYVGDIDPSVTEEQLIQTFSRFDGYFSAVLCPNSFHQRSLGYGYVNFQNIQGATRAIEALNHTLMNGKAIRIMWSQPNSEARLSGIGNVFVKNLACVIDNMKLHEIFSKFGNILSCKVSVYEDGKSKGYGFVQYTMEESALEAIQNLNGSNIEGKELYVGHFIRRADRFRAEEFNNLYIKNFDYDVTEQLLEEKFSKFGKITSLVISKDANGISKGFGFVNFEDTEDAKRAKNTMHGSMLGSKVLYVARAQKKAERKPILRAQFDRMRIERAQRNKDRNLYVKNINDDVDDMKLKEYFSQCGSITSVKVMQNEKGIGKGFGFVCFSKPEEANRAMNTLNGVLFHGKPLDIAIAQTKQERKTFLQMVYAKRTAEARGFSYPTLYHGALQVYQVPEFRIPGSRVNGFTPLIGQNRTPPFPLLPMHVPNTAREHGGWMNGHVNFRMPFMETNFQWPSHSYQQQGARLATNNLSINGHGFARAASQSEQELSTVLAAATPEKRKDILGNKLYPLVKKLKPDLSPKIIQMLLDLDHSELLVLLDAPELLSTKVEEVMKMLQLSETKGNGESSGI